MERYDCHHLDGGKRRHRQRAAEQVIKARAPYDSARLAALQNYADVLHAIQSDAVALKADSPAETATRATRAVTLDQQTIG